MEEMDPQLVYSLDVPGPGSYTYANKAFGTSARPSRQPAVGKSRTESMACLLNDQQVKNPGPGAYRVLPLLGSSKRSVVSMKTRSYRELADGVPKGARRSPDAGQYDIGTAKKLTQTSVKFGLFGTSIR